jgi:hypothetical protein
MKPENLVFFGPIMKIVDLGIAQKEVMGLDLFFLRIYLLIYMFVYIDIIQMYDPLVLQIIVRPNVLCLMHMFHQKLIYGQQVLFFTL